MSRYRVVGAHAVYGVEPGEVFEADLSEWQERVLIEGGHIRPVGEPVPTPAEQKKEE